MLSLSHAGTSLVEVPPPAPPTDYWTLHAKYQAVIHATTPPPSHTTEEKPTRIKPADMTEQQMALYLGMRIEEVNKRPKPNRPKQKRERRISRQQQKEDDR